MKSRPLGTKLSLLFASLALLALLGSSCAGEGGPQSAGTTVTEAPTTTLPPVAEWTGGELVRAVFTSLAEQQPSAHYFVPRELPAGSRVAEGWWPVASSEEPPPQEQWEANPRVLGGDPQGEVRLVVRSGEGWLEFLEGIQGDLGNLPGERTILVAGREASVHTMMGGTVVQWSDGPLWFALFGRGIAQEDVVRVAKGMQLLADDPAPDAG